MDASAPPLIGADDPAPFTRVNPAGRAPVLLVCDHASHAVPRALDGLGLDPAVLRRHIGWDIGAAAVTRSLALRLDAPAVLAGYSRLVIDCNRRLDDPTSVMAESDGVAVPGNRGLDDAARSRRQQCFWPYHHAIAAALDGMQANGVEPALVSVHSFTPRFAGQRRPWHVGLLWHEDDRLFRPLFAALSAEAAITVGDNQPYHGASPHAYTIPVHARRRGLRHLQFEIRQDLIATADGAEGWADRIGRALAAVLGDGRPLGAAAS